MLEQFFIVMGIIFSFVSYLALDALMLVLIILFATKVAQIPVIGEPTKWALGSLARGLKKFE